MKETTGKDVNVKYDNFNNNTVSDIEFDLLDDILFSVSYSNDQNGLYITMSDKITTNAELQGFIDYEKLNVLIKALCMLRNQLKSS